LSQEILVLDFNEELPSSFPKYSLPKEESVRRPDYGIGGVGPSREPFESNPDFEGNSCPTRNSVLVLSVVCAMMLLLYVASAVCFMAKSRPWRSSSLGPHHKHIMQ